MEPQVRNRHRLIVTVITLAVVVIGAGVWAIVAANQTDDIDITTGLVDDWLAAVNAPGLHGASGEQLTMP